MRVFVHRLGWRRYENVLFSQQKTAFSFRWEWSYNFLAGRQKKQNKKFTLKPKKCARIKKSSNKTHWQK